MKWVKPVWKWSWLMTLPVTIAFIYWGEVTVDRYLTFNVRYPSLFGNLYSYGEKEFQFLLRKAKLAINGPVQRRKLENGPLKTIHLFVPESNLAKLNSHLPQSGFDYVDGGIWDGRQIRKVKVKYRGDNSFHWDYYKKSLRIKTKKSYLFEGMRSFNLVVPKLEEKLQNYLGYKFAKDMGLVAPNCELVNVTLNGKLLGVYVMVEKLDEMTLRKNKLMPADIYSGELVGMDAYNGVSPEVFLHPRLWKKAAVNNHYPKDFYKPLESLLHLVNTRSSEHVHEELNDLLDMEAWGKFAAFETLTQTFHYDDQHNWRIYYDPYRRGFVPLVWDPVAWHTGWRPRQNEKAQLDILSSKLHELLFKNGDFLRARHNAIEKFFATGKDKLFLQKVDQTIKAVTPALLEDPNIRPSDPKRSIGAMQRLRADIERVFDDVKHGFIEDIGTVTYASLGNGSYRLRIEGRRPLTSIIFCYARPIDGNVQANLHYLQDGKVVDSDITGSIKVEVNRIRLSKVLLSRMTSTFNEQSRTRWQRHQKNVLPGYYELTLSGIRDENQLVQMIYERVDKKGIVDYAKTLPLESFEDMYCVAPENPPTFPEVWEGEVLLENITELVTPLIIRPGTTVRLKSGVSLIIKNLIMAEGSAESPIRFIPAAKSQKPWGAMVLWGSGANGSRLKYCEFEGGSGNKGDLFEYTAMVSIHDVQGVEIQNTKFRESRLTDDMVHTVYAKVHFSDCRFEKSLMDALDLDISDAIIERCYFGNSGNDAIDMMTSNVIVLDTTMEVSGDKAISVGEGSKLMAINNVLRNNMIGVQVKDGSVAALMNIDLIDNKHALDAYKKNWRYNGGGEIFVHKAILKNNDKMITADKKSEIHVFDSYIDRDILSRKHVIIDASVDRSTQQRAHIAKLLRQPKELNAMKVFDSYYWERVDANRRGALKVGCN